ALAFPAARAGRPAEGGGVLMAVLRRGRRVCPWPARAWGLIPVGRCRRAYVPARPRPAALPIALVLSRLPRPRPDQGTSRPGRRDAGRDHRRVAASAASAAAAHGAHLSQLLAGLPPGIGADAVGHEHAEERGQADLDARARIVGSPSRG